MPVIATLRTVDFIIVIKRDITRKHAGPAGTYTKRRGRRKSADKKSSLAMFMQKGWKQIYLALIFK